MTICVTGVSYQATEDDFRGLFSEYGDVKKVTIFLDRETGKPKGIAHVEMGSDAQETAAIEALDGTEWMGKVMKVSKARPPEESAGGNRKKRTGGNWQ